MQPVSKVSRLDRKLVSHWTASKQLAAQGMRVLGERDKRIPLWMGCIRRHGGPLVHGYHILRVSRADLIPNPTWSTAP